MKTKPKQTWLSNWESFRSKTQIELILALLVVTLMYLQIEPKPESPSAKPSDSSGTMLPSAPRDTLGQRSSQRSKTSPQQNIIDTVKAGFIQSGDSAGLNWSWLAALQTQRDSLLSSYPSRQGSWLIYILALVTVAVAGYAFWGYMTRRNLPATESYSDPPYLTQAFQKFSEAMKDLGTPRKIKRFSNKVRLQQKLIQSRTPINLSDESAIRAFFLMLLSMEVDKTLVKSEKDEFPGKIVSKAENLEMKYLQNKTIFVSDQRYAMAREIYEMNKNVLV
jgi:hypothetical protein